MKFSTSIILATFVTFVTFLGGDALHVSLKTAGAYWEPDKKVKGLYIHGEGHLEDPTSRWNMEQCNAEIERLEKKLREMCNPNDPCGDSLMTRAVEDRIDKVQGWKRVLEITQADNDLHK